MRCAPGAVVNLATGTLTSVRSFALCAARELGMSEQQLRFGALPTRAEEMEHEPVHISRLRALASWSPRIGVEEGIRRTLRLEDRAAESSASVAERLGG